MRKRRYRKKKDALRIEIFCEQSEIFFLLAGPSLVAESSVGASSER